MSNTDRLASLRAKAEAALRPDVETEISLLALLKGSYAPIFEAVQQINDEVRSIRTEYFAGIYHVRTELAERMWVQRMTFSRSPSEAREMILTLWPNKGTLVLSAQGQQSAMELAQFTPEGAAQTVATIFDEAERFYGRL